MSNKRKPLLSLTNKQRETIKGALDAKTMGCALALMAKRRDGDEFDRKYDAGMKRYEEIVQALSVLGVTIEGHEPRNCSDSLTFVALDGSKDP
jgi:hypothetical protein